MYIHFPSLAVVHIQIPSAIRTLAAEFESIGEIALTEIADDGIRLYQQEIVKEGSVYTGHFLNTVSVQRASWHERDIGSDAFYSGVVRRKGSGEVIGPQLAERAILNLGASVESAVARQLAR